MADDTRDIIAPSEDAVADLREDIDLNTGLLASLEEDDFPDVETQESIQVIRKSLKILRQRLKSWTQPSSSMAAAQADGHSENTPTDDFSRFTVERAAEDNSSVAHSGSDAHNRKRQRGRADDDNDSRASKSLKPSPSLPASASSPAASTASLDSLDLEDGWLFGNMMSPEELQEQKKYLKELEQRKKQEDADAELAKSYAETVPPSSHASTSQRPLPVPASSSQSFFRGDGSFNHNRQSRAAAEGLKVEAADESSHRRSLRLPPSPQLSASSRSVTPSSSVDSFQEIPASQFIPRVGAPSHHRAAFNSGMSIVPSRPTMPGTFPGDSPYSSVAGSAVYNPQPYNGANPALSRHALAQGILARAEFNRKLEGLGHAAPSGYARGILNQLNPWVDDSADPAKTQEEIKDLLKHIRPDEELTDEQLAEMPQGLARPLMPHQISGLSWMKKMEEGSNMGGILADDMGLGKTVQAISLMLARPAPETDRRPTLVVAPVALMHQWKRELEKFVRPRFRFNVLVLHGANRAETYSAIRGYDVILTTYGTLASELKRRLVYEDKCKTAADPSAIRENCAILGFKSKFHRIFLDEAQNIKNRNTKTAIAACRISATHRWCLTGTPMQNNVEEMYSLIKFCRIRPYNAWDKFSKDIARPLKSRNESSKDRAMQTLQVLLRAILLRRTKQSKINGQPLLRLPEKRIVEERAVFDRDQLDFYEKLEQQAQITFNRYLRNNSVGRNYSHALVLLLRLRQACCHPTLIVNSKDFQQTVSDLQPMDMAENAKLLPDSVVDRLKEQETEGFECPVCMDADENPTIFQCGHAVCADCMAKLTDAAISSLEGSSAKCPHCRATIDANKITDLTSFIRVYFPGRDGVEPLDDLVDGDDSESDSADDDSGSDDGADLRDFIVADDDDMENDTDDGTVAKQKPKNKSKKSKARRRQDKGKGKKKKNDVVSFAQLRKEGLRSQSAKKKYLRRLAKDFVSSAKIDKTITLLEQIHERGENEKTIIFSNFTSFLDLLEVPLSRHHYFETYSRYDGSMTPAARNDAVVSFTEKPNNKIILVSLKAGNSGLNLTAANHVIMLDPFWNPFVEYQAADRCYRIGQEKEVTVHRILIGESEEQGSSGGKNVPGDVAERADFTVEDRILKLQEKKKFLVETALDESAGSQLVRLGVRELGYLFGVNSL